MYVCRLNCILFAFNEGQPRNILQPQTRLAEKTEEPNWKLQSATLTRKRRLRILPPLMEAVTTPLTSEGGNFHGYNTTISQDHNNDKRLDPST